MADDNIDTLARTIYGEARGEGVAGMQAVACVVMNRAALARAYVSKHKKPHPLFGDGSVACACRQPWQFSCWNEADPNSRVIHDVTMKDQVFATAYAFAILAVLGKLSDSTDEATHYYDARSPMPKWAEGKMPCDVIGHHFFFNDIEREAVDFTTSTTLPVSTVSSSGEMTSGGIK